MPQIHLLTRTIICLLLLVSGQALAQQYDNGRSGEIDPPNFNISEVAFDRSFEVTWSGAQCAKRGSNEYVNLSITVNVFDQKNNLVSSAKICNRNSYSVEGLAGGVYSVSAKIDFDERYEEDCDGDDGSCSSSDYTKWSKFSEPKFIVVPDIDFVESQNQTYGCKVQSASVSGDACKVIPQWEFGSESKSESISASYPSRQSGNAKVTLASAPQGYAPSVKSSGQDLFLNIARPKAGTFVSWNKLSSIALKGNTLKVLNTSSLNSNLRVSGEASQIVLDLSAFSSNILLDGEISVIGKPADLIVLFGDKSLSCSGCSVIGTPRVLFASGTESSVKYSSGLIDTITTGKGSIKVDNYGLKAEGLAFVDFAAKDILLDGDISLNISVDVDGDNIKVNEQGAKTAASGFLRIYLGEFTYEYNKGEISQPKAKTVSRFYQSQNSRINAGNIFIDAKAALGSFWVQGEMSTKADLVMASFYKGEAVIPEQKINFTSIVDIYVQGQFLSAGETTVATGGDLIIQSLSNSKDVFDVYGLNFAAVGRIANYSSIVSEKMVMAANEIINEGDIEAKADLKMTGALGVYNQFGGFILANQIDINSPGGFVVNGSLRPYKYGMVDSSGCAGGLFCKPGDPTFSSTYEDLSDDPGGLVPLLVTNLSATILGNNIDIDTKRFQNVNPYYVFNKGQVIDPNGVRLDAKLGDQVIVSALQNLTVNADGHILNSSAIAESVTGELALNSSVVTNERYRVRVGTKAGGPLPENFCQLYNDCVLADNESTTTTTTQQVLEYYSPAGRFYSGGRALINASFSFINDLSYFEIHGDLDLLVNHVLQIGLDLDHTATVYKTTNHSKRYCKARALGKCVDRSTKYWSTHEEYERGLDRESIPALFAVEGYLFGEGADKFQVTTVISQ